MIKWILKTKFAWRISGLTYFTASIATAGKYLSVSENILEAKRNTEFLMPYISPDKDVLEFGSGLGRNIISIGNNIKIGIGMDINGLYIHQAKRLAKKLGTSNLKFIKYNGINFPKLEKVDVIFEMGVFERIPKDRVSYYLKTLKDFYLKEDGIFFLYFLMTRAKDSEFTKRLGNESYQLWKEEEVCELHKNLQLKVLEIKQRKFDSIFISTRSNAV